MKIGKDKIISGIALLFLAVIFFTPLGKTIKVKMNEWTLSGPSTEKPEREFSLADENMNISLKGYNGTPDANLADFRGKVVFLNFWGSWCPPCVAEMPSIQKLYESKGNQVAFVLIAMNDKPEDFVPFLQEKNYKLPVYEAGSLLPKVLIPGSFPTTYIINKRGEVVTKEISAADWNSPEVNRLIDKLLAE
jgi:thiol-disulfide isomerase/thioredoxin